MLLLNEEHTFKMVCSAICLTPTLQNWANEDNEKNSQNKVQNRKKPALSDWLGSFADVANIPGLTRCSLGSGSGVLPTGISFLEKCIANKSYNTKSSNTPPLWGASVLPTARSISSPSLLLLTHNAVQKLSFILFNIFSWVWTVSRYFIIVARKRMVEIMPRWIIHWLGWIKYKLESLFGFYECWWTIKYKYKYF